MSFAFGNPPAATIRGNDESNSTSPQLRGTQETALLDFQHSSKVSQREIVAHVEQRAALFLCQLIAKAITEIEARSTIASGKPSSP
jgi:hypothetical protein